MGHNCYRIRNQFSDLIDGILSPAERAAVETHAAGCADCARELARLRRTTELVRGMPQLQPSPEFTEKLMARVREDRPEDRNLDWPVRVPSAPARIHTFNYWLPRIAAAAAVAALTVGVWRLMTHPRANSGPAPVAVQAASPPAAGKPSSVPAAGQLARRETAPAALKDHRRGPGSPGRAGRLGGSGRDSLYDQPYDQDLHALPPYDSGTPVSGPEDTSVHLQPATSPGKNLN